MGCPPHHWDIDSFPLKGKYHARCKNCAAETDFPAWPPDEAEKPFVIEPKDGEAILPKKKRLPKKSV